MDLTTITAALSGIKTATDIARAIKVADSSIETAELKFQIASLVEALADTKMNVVDIRALLDEKEMEISQLKKRNNMVFDGLVYWEENEGSTKKEGPYCPKCHDSDSKFVRVHVENDGTAYRCYTCNNYFSHNKGVF